MPAQLATTAAPGNGSVAVAAGGPPGARPLPTLLPTAPPPPTNGPGGPSRRGPVLPVGRRAAGGTAPAPRAIPTLSPVPAPPAMGPSAVVTPPPPMRADTLTAPHGVPAVPPPLPPEWSEALGHARTPLGEDTGGFDPSGFGGGPGGLGGLDSLGSFDSFGSSGGGPGLGGAGVPFGPPASPAAPLDRRSSAALEPPPVERDRRNTVALSLAGLFDDLGAPEITTEAAPAPAKRTTPSFFDADDEADETANAGPPRRTGLRGWFTPAGIVAVLAVIGALYIVGYFVSKENPPKPPGDQVTAVSHTH